jgi:RNA polymerase sigma factor (sigma-70 family)
MPAEPEPALQRLLAEEPFVRLLARTLVADDGDEVVQRTWLLALRHGGEDVGAARSWLARVVRNVATNLRRERQRRARHEHGAAPPEAAAVPSSAELAQREERRRELVAAVDALPEPLRAVLLLRYFDGLPPRAIAQRLQLPVATVWNRHRRALALLRERLDADHGGDRRAWALPLVPFAAGLPLRSLPPAVAAPPAATPTISLTGVLLMTTKTKLAGSLLLLAVVAAFVLWRTAGHVPPEPAPRAGDAVAAVVEVPRAQPDAAPSAIVPPRTDADARTGGAVAAPTTGALLVRVLHHDGSPATAVTVILRTRPDGSRLESPRSGTDERGTVRFDDLAPGRCDVWTDRRHPATAATVRAGETSEVEHRLPAGLTIRGVVVDAAGVPVQGALVEMVAVALLGADAEVVATSGGDGRFVVHAAPTQALVGARADGRCASPMQRVFGNDGNIAEVTLRLGAPAGAVEGVVVDGAGTPVADAWIKVGAGRTEGIAATMDGAPPLPALVRSARDGTFRAVGVAPGTQPVQAQALDRASWSGSCDVAAGLTARLRIELAAGARVRGVVRDEAGQPVAGAEVVVGEVGDFARVRQRSATDGSYELRSLPAGEIAILAQHAGHGRAEARVRTESGATSVHDLVLSPGLVLQGRVEDENGAPVAGAYVTCLGGNGEPWRASRRSDADGGFRAVGCPPGDLLSIDVHAKGFADLRRSGIAAGATVVRLRLQREAPPSARVVGTVTGVDGAPIANATVIPMRRGTNFSTDLRASDADGRFTTGLLSPGSWSLLIEASGWPTFCSEDLVLAAEAVHDLGVIRMLPGGTVRVTVDGERTGTRFVVTAAVAAAPQSVLRDVGGALCSDPLRPGAYRLMVSGSDTAAAAIPFTVSTGEVTRLAVSPAKGVRQQVAIDVALLDIPPPWVLLQVHRGTELLARTPVKLAAGQAATASLCLRPGDYTVVADTGDRELARATFTVGEHEGPPLQLTLR